MNITPIRILRLLMEYSTILMQFENLYENADLEDEEAKSTRDSIILMCDRVEWMINFIEEKKDFTYEDITDDVDALYAFLVSTKVAVAAIKETMRSE